MKIGDLVKIKLPSSKGLYLVLGRTDNIELETLSSDRCWKLYGYWYSELQVFDMYEKWLEIISEV